MNTTFAEEKSLALSDDASADSSESSSTLYVIFAVAFCVAVTIIGFFLYRFRWRRNSKDKKDDNSDDDDWDPRNIDNMDEMGLSLKKKVTVSVIRKHKSTFTVDDSNAQHSQRYIVDEDEHSDSSHSDPKTQPQSNNNASNGSTASKVEQSMAGQIAGNEPDRCAERY